LDVLCMTCFVSKKLAAQTNSVDFACYGYSKTNKARVSYSVAQYTLKGVVPENQVKSIIKDKNGFYWILTPGGFLLRWNGRELTLINHNANNEPLHSTFLHIATGQNDSLFLVDNNLNYYYLDINSQVVAFDSAEKYLYPYNQTFNSFSKFGYTTIKTAEVRKLNAPRLFKELTGFNFISSKRTYVKPDEFYQLSPDTTMLYFKQGKLKELNIQKKLAGSLYIVGNYLVIDRNGYYEVFEEGNKISAGYNPLLNFIGDAVINGQINDSSIFFSNNNCIYQMHAPNGKLIIEKYFEADPKLVFNHFYCDEESERVYLVTLSGGFCVCQQNLFLNKQVSNNPVHNIVYSILPVGDRLFTNQDFRRFVSDDEDYFYNTPIFHFGKYFLYPVSIKTSLFDNHFRLKKSWRIGEIQNKSFVNYNGKVYLAPGKLVEFDTSSLQVKEVKLKDPLTPTEALFYIAKGPGNLMYAVIDTLIYQINLSDNTRTKLSFHKLCNLGYIRSLYYDEQLNMLFITASGLGIYYMDLSGPDRTIS
ncbi:MAG: hypothetical protein ABUT20_63900, partial [Bacteroidota bacterium]